MQNRYFQLRRILSPSYYWRVMRYAGLFLGVGIMLFLQPERFEGGTYNFLRDLSTAHLWAASYALLGAGIMIALHVKGIRPAKVLIGISTGLTVMWAVAFLFASLAGYSQSGSGFVLYLYFALEGFSLIKEQGSPDVMLIDRND